MLWSAAPTSIWFVLVGCAVIPWLPLVNAQTRSPNECIVSGKAVGQCMQVDSNGNVIDDHYSNVRGGKCKDQFNNDKALIDLSRGGSTGNCPKAPYADEK